VAVERSSVQSAGSSVQSGASSVQSGASSVQSGASSVQSGAVEAGDELLAQIAQRRWTRRQDMKVAILLVCRDRFVTAAEVASVLGRSAETLRTHYLGRMVEAGELNLRYPDRASHPDQAYQASGGRPPRAAD
jgi:ATP-dependent DNA helicase RecG